MTGHAGEPPPTEIRDLVSRCCRLDTLAWDDFVLRFNRSVSLYVVRACRFADGPSEARREAMRDLVQDVYSRLLADDCRALRAWRGETEESLRSYLARIAHAVVCDALRHDLAKKRAARLVSLDERDPDGDFAVGDRIPAPEGTSPDRLLAERLAPSRLREYLGSLGSEPNGARNALIFQLHVIDGLTASEIAAMPGLGLNVPAVESILRRTRERLKKIIGDPDMLTG